MTTETSKLIADDRTARRPFDTAMLLATWFGCGRSPWAPGTVGTLGALPLYFVLRRLAPLTYWSAVAALTAAGIWASERAARTLGDDDPSAVVIDEVVGALIALGFTRGASGHLLSLLLFRAFDILKPGIIDRVQNARPPGLGIMADDLLAGLAAGVTARLLSRRARRGR